MRAAFCCRNKRFVGKCYCEWVYIVCHVYNVYARWTIQQQFRQVNGYMCARLLHASLFCFFFLRIFMCVGVLWFLVAVEVFSFISIVVVVVIFFFFVLLLVWYASVILLVNVHLHFHHINTTCAAFTVSWNNLHNFTYIYL